MDVGKMFEKKDFFQGRLTVVKFNYTPKLRENRFSNNRLIAKYNISKSGVGRDSFPLSDAHGIRLYGAYWKIFKALSSQDRD